MVDRLAADVRAAFPEMRGLSRTNVWPTRAMADAWEREAIVQQPVGRLPWGHVIVLLTKKVSRFAHAHAGQLGFYVAWVEEDLRVPERHAPTVGIVLCTTRSDDVGLLPGRGALADGGGHLHP